MWGFNVYTIMAKKSNNTSQEYDFSVNLSNKKRAEMNKAKMNAGKSLNKLSNTVYDAVSTNPDEEARKRSKNEYAYYLDKFIQETPFSKYGQPDVNETNI